VLIFHASVAKVYLTLSQMMETKQEHHLTGKVGHHTILEEATKVKEMEKGE